MIIGGKHALGWKQNLEKIERARQERLGTIKAHKRASRHRAWLQVQIEGKKK